LAARRLLSPVLLIVSILQPVVIVPPVPSVAHPREPELRKHPFHTTHTPDKKPVKLSSEQTAFEGILIFA
jgi:hypothetical protein